MIALEGIQNFSTVSGDVRNSESRSLFTNLFKWDRSTHILIILSEFFLGATTIGAYHSVGTVTGEMMPCSKSRSSSALSLIRERNRVRRTYTKGLGTFS